MGLGTYEGKGKILVQGRLQAEANELRKSAVGNNQKVHTFHKNLAGKSDGPREVEITIGSAIPVAGFETDFEQMLADGAYVEMVVIKAGKRTTYVGWIESYDETDSVNAATSSSAVFMGKIKGSTGGLLGAIGIR